MRLCPHLAHPPERRSERFATLLCGGARLATLQLVPERKHTENQQDPKVWECVHQAR